MTLLTGKTADSFLPSEIYGTEGTIQLNGVNSIESLNVYKRKNREEMIFSLETKSNPMTEEAAAFARIIENRNDAKVREDYQALLTITKTVNQLLVELRRSANIQFPADIQQEKGN